MHTQVEIVTYDISLNSSFSSVSLKLQRSTPCTGSIKLFTRTRAIFVQLQLGFVSYSHSTPMAIFKTSDTLPPLCSFSISIALLGSFSKIKPECSIDSFSLFLNHCVISSRQDRKEQ
jgi:hypothetical protein